MTPHETADRVLELRLLSYALAAGATLALTTTAQAEVLFTPSNAVLTRIGKLAIDLDHDGSVDFKLNLKEVCSYSCIVRFGSLHAYGAQPANGVGMNDAGNAAALRRGARIDSDLRVRHDALMASAFGNSNGDWENVANRFLGVRFVIKNKVHAGWIGFRNVIADYQTHELTVTLAGWAYESNPDTPVVAGDKGTGNPSSIQPTSLKILSSGHAAIDERRKRTADNGLN